MTVKLTLNCSIKENIQESIYNGCTQLVLFQFKPKVLISLINSQQVFIKQQFYVYLMQNQNFKSNKLKKRQIFLSRF